MVAQQLQGTERCRAGVHQQWSQTQGELPRHFSATSMHTVLSPVGGGGIGTQAPSPCLLALLLLSRRARALN